MSQPTNENNGRRVMVIGLDGATFDLIRPWAEQGLLPTFSRLMEEGAYGPLTTIVPPLTGPAWISFLTGKNPGKHRIYDFVGRSAASYTGAPVNASQRDGDSLWAILSQAEKQVGVFMVPVTYPPEPVNGFMVTGMMTPTSATDFTYPLELAVELKAAVPNMTIAPEGLAHPLGREPELVQGLDNLSNMMMDATRYLHGRYQPDFYMAVFKEPDVAMHWLWRYMDETHPWYVETADDSLRQGLLNVYRRMDECVAELLQMAGDDTLVILMSDHGAGPLDTYFHVNSWLAETGFLQFKKDPFTQVKRLLYKLGVTPINLYKLIMNLRQGKQVANTMQHRKKSALSMLRKIFLSFDSVDWSRSRAYSLGNFGQIYVNLKGRDLQGIVNPGEEYEQVIQDLTERLENLINPHTGKPIPGKVYRREEIYHGEHLEEAPDLIFMPDDLRINGFGLFQFPSKSWLAPTFDRSGGHRMDGIVTFAGPGVRSGKQIEGAKLIDLAPTILAAMGVPIPDDMDGRVLAEALDDDYFAERPIRYATAEKITSQQRVDYSAEDEEEIKERLRGLGYMA
ncbi:MAG: hypothetical protein GY796_26955 [Chloroflexi bacterium]|nr:hypothetical protein [Chloroflexota bacterium]